MNETDRPNLSLGEPPGALKRVSQPLSKGWLWLFLLFHLAVLAGVLMILMRPARPTVPVGAAGPGPAPDELRTVAMELEDRSLNGRAAEAWETYLAAAPDADNRAEILYRAGKLYFDADRFEEAADALVRAKLAGEGDKQLQLKIGPKLVDCLRRLGRYGEVGRELSRQVEVGSEDTGKGRVLATFAGEEITEAALDRMIERRVDQMLGLSGASGNETDRQELLRQFSSPKARQEMLRQLLQTELFVRRARELRIDREEEYIRGRELMEQNLLMARLVTREFEKIQPTDVDLEGYYKANQEQYKEPESMDLLVVELAKDEDAAALVDQVKSAEDFRKLAKDHKSGDDASADPPTLRVVRGRNDQMLGDTSTLFDLPEGQWTQEPHVHGDRRFLILVETKTAERTPPLAEVRARVEAEYVARKRSEVSERLFRDLKARYGVRVFPPDETNQEPEDEDEEKTE
jgi:hypothetical protein